jgi:organic radical activating enzyme
MSELYYSIQGESIYAGKPSVFFRTVGCDLLCKFRGPGGKEHICDTIEQWNIPGTPYTYNELYDKMETLGFIQLLDPQGPIKANLVHTGGAVELWQDDIACFWDYFQTRAGFKPFVELESAATISPTDHFAKQIQHLNASVKLKSSGNPDYKRWKPEVWRRWVSLASQYSITYVLKPVFTGRPDVEEIETIRNIWQLPADKVQLMPEGDQPERLHRNMVEAAEVCKEMGYILCPRLHITLYGKRPGT